MIIKIKLILRQTIKFIYVNFTYNIVVMMVTYIFIGGLLYGFDENDIRECSKIERTHFLMYIQVDVGVDTDIYIYVARVCR